MAQPREFPRGDIPIERKVHILWLSVLFLACSPAEDAKDDAAEQPVASTDEPSPDVMNQLRGTATGGASHPGAALYDTHCASCHSVAVSRAPHRSFLEMMSPESLAATLREGVMQQQAKAMTDEEQKLVVEYLVGARPESADFAPFACEGGCDRLRLRATAVCRRLGDGQRKYAIRHRRSRPARGLRSPKLEAQMGVCVPERDPYPLATQLRGRHDPGRQPGRHCLFAGR